MQCNLSGGSQFFWGETGGPCFRGNGGSVAAFYTLAGPQFNPPVNSCNPCQLNSSTTGGILVSLFDGSTRMVPQGISQTTWQYAVVPNDGLVLGPDW
jgi:hypothetical protein